MPHKRLFKTTVLSGLCLALSFGPALANPCTSQWQALTGTFKALAPLGAMLICNTQDTDPQVCVDNYEDAKAEIEQWKAAHNSVNAGPGHIGPRGCAPTYDYSGNVKAERVFVCTPVVERRWKLDFEITGGKGNRPLTVDVCLVDGETGQAVRHFTQTFDGARDSVGMTFDKKTYFKATGLIPMIYLHKQVGTRGYRYSLSVDEANGEPRAIELARMNAGIVKKN